MAVRARVGGTAGVAVLLIAVAGCRAAAPSLAGLTPPGSVAPESSDAAVGGVAGDDLTSLSIELPKETWRTSEPITGSATLHLKRSPSMTVYGSGSGLVGFDYAEIGGSRHVAWVQTADCGGHPLVSASPVPTTLYKSGAFEPSASGADFYRSFLTDPEIHLPVGDWKISARTEFFTEAMCSGGRHALTASVTIHVVP